MRCAVSVAASRVFSRIYFPSRVRIQLPVVIVVHLFMLEITGDAATETAQRIQRNVSNLPITSEALAGVLGAGVDRKSTRLNSSHVRISYAVFCLKKKKKKTRTCNKIYSIDRLLSDTHNQTRH